MGTVPAATASAYALSAVRAELLIASYPILSVDWLGVAPAAVGAFLASLLVGRADRSPWQI
jgi:hypothetical protein